MVVSKALRAPEIAETVPIPTPPWTIPPTVSFAPLRVLEESPERWLAVWIAPLADWRIVPNPMLGLPDITTERISGTLPQNITPIKMVKR